MVSKIPQEMLSPITTGAIGDLQNSISKIEDVAEFTNDGVSFYGSASPTILPSGTLSAFQKRHNLLDYPGAGVGSAAADTASMVGAITSGARRITIPRTNTPWLIDPTALNAALALRLGSSQTYDLDIHGDGMPDVQPSAPGAYLFDLRGGTISIDNIRINDPQSRLTGSGINIFKTTPYHLILDRLEFTTINKGIRIESAAKINLSRIDAINVPLLIHRPHVPGTLCVDSGFYHIRANNSKILWEGYSNEGLTWDNIVLLCFDGNAMTIKQCLSSVIRDSILDSQYTDSETPGQGGVGLVLGGYTDDANNGLTIQSCFVGAGKNAPAYIYANPTSPNTNIIIDDIECGVQPGDVGTIPYRLDLQNINKLTLGKITSVGGAPTLDRLSGSNEGRRISWPVTSTHLSVGNGRILSQTGDLTSASGDLYWKQLDDMIHFDMQVTLTDVGTAGGILILNGTLPLAKYGEPIFTGRLGGGSVVSANLSNGNLLVLNFNGGSVITNDNTIKINGSYFAA